MKFSAAAAARKWSCRGFGGCEASMVTVAVLLLGLFATPAMARLSTPDFAHGKVPMPRPRPADAPALEPQPAGETPSDEQPVVEQTKPAVRPLSACRQALTEAIAIAPSIPDIHGTGGCGGEDLVRLEAVVLADKTRIALKPAATLRCTMASAIADWVRTDMVPLATSLGTKLADLDNFDSFECRGRNRVVGAKLSEHGRANALDVRGLKLANGQSIALTDRAGSREIREKVLASVCARFTTVLGPGSDWYHEDHIHLDLAERRGGYRICQWNVWDSLPTVAPLLPAERPEEAPPREVVAKIDPAKTDAGKTEPGKGDPDAVPSNDVEGQDAAEPAAPAPKPAATKKRRSNRRF